MAGRGNSIWEGPMAKESTVHLLQCPQPHPRVPQPTSFYPPLLGRPALYCLSNGQAWVWAPLHPPAPLP